MSKQKRSEALSFLNEIANVEGDFSIVDMEGKEFGLAGRTVISLCRCGHSQNKPFCDGHHNAQGFDSVCPARDLPPPKPKVAPPITPA